MLTALVLGGGGVAGIAWEAGVIHGLRRAGVDLTTADLLVGTSAGSVVGTVIAQGADLEQAITVRATVPGPELMPDLDAAMRALGVLADTTLDQNQLRQAVGQLALKASTGPEGPWVETIAAGLPSRQWPDRRLLITAVDALTGDFVVWDRDSGVPLELAIAASCAVPCIVSPVSVNGSRYMDGGVPSSTNADLATGASAVVVLDPLAPLMPGERVDEELASTGATATAVVGPDEASVAAFGTDMLDQSLWLPVFAAGQQQAAALTDEIAAVWSHLRGLIRQASMKLTIFAATGGVGRQLLDQALEAGHDVTVVVRNPLKLPEHASGASGVRVVTTDMSAPSPDALKAAVTDADAVLSCIGPHSNSDAGIAAPATRAIVTAMHAAGVERIVAISASPVSTEPSPGRPNPPRHDPADGFFMRYVGERVAKTLFSKVYADLARMEDELRDSDLGWTVLRPPKLTNKPLTGRYRTAIGQNVRGGFSVPRADVAHQMLAVLGQPETIRQVVGIAT